MLAIKMRRVDGYEIYEHAETLSEAVSFIENEAINTAGDTWSGALDTIFPIYWRIINKTTAEQIAAGFVDEYGEIT